MKTYLLAALLAGAAVPAVAQAADAAKPGGSGKSAGAAKDAPDKAKAKDFDPAQLMAMFDKIFPAQPEPSAGRLELSRVTASAIFPDGTYGRIFDQMLGGMVDRVMGLSEADLGGGKSGAASTTTLREQAAAKDPHFDERMRIMRRVIGEEFARIAGIIEPKMREGVARSMARRFDEPQLTTINAFLATDTGRAFGAQSMEMWVDPDVMRAMVTAFPEMMVAMPAAMKRIEAATAHLPKPPKPPKAAADEDKAEDSGGEQEEPGAEGSDA